MKSILSLVLALFALSELHGAGVMEPISLWPKEVPGEVGYIGVEQDSSTASSRSVDGKPVIRLTNVTNPTITIFKPSPSLANGTAVVVCPGGGYKILAYDLEGTEICQWLNSLGVTAALLKYRVPPRSNDEGHILPLQDAQRALGLVRFHAKDWNLAPDRIGIMGFSAGGHLTARLSNTFSKREYEAIDAADETSCRPDFALMIYPAYLTAKEKGVQLAPELNVTSNAPPTFLMQTEDDAVKVESSLVYYEALKKAHVPAEMHVFATGGHGYGMRGKAVGDWPKRAEEWMRGRGLLRSHLINRGGAR